MESSHLDRLVVKDNFYPNPEFVRQAAIESKYEDPPVNSGRLARTALCTEQQAADMCQLLGSYVPEQDIVSVNILFRYTLANTVKKTFCHVDGCAYAGIVYLTLPEHCAGGTSIYSHGPTGDTIYNPANAHRYNFNDPEQWKLIREIEMVYNRLVFYPGQLFHALTPVFFGNDIKDSRLTQNVFIYRQGDEALKLSVSA